VSAQHSLIDELDGLTHWLTGRFSDPFADEGDPLGGNQDVGSQQNYLHIRIQQRNGRKTLTTLQGLPKGELWLFPSQSSSDTAVSRV